MDELIIAQIDTDMRNGVTHDTKKHEIARLQRCYLDAASKLADGLRAVGQRDPADLIENVTHETAAIETAFGAGSAPAVGNTVLVERELEQILDWVGERHRCGFRRTDRVRQPQSLAIFRRVRAAAEQKRANNNEYPYSHRGESLKAFRFSVKRRLSR